MDLDFWGLDDIHLQPCCVMKYYPQTTSARSEIDEEMKEEEKAKVKVFFPISFLYYMFSSKESEEHFGDHLTGRVRRRLWDLLEYPETSKPAQFISVLSIAIVCLSTVTLMVTSLYHLPPSCRLKLCLKMT